MKIFLSYPRELRDLADRVRLALAADGNDVFFDRQQLAAGREFDNAIRRAIDKCDLIVFLVTPGSVAEGTYTRTELKFAESRWPHPKGRVLPVMVRPTDIESIPPYVRAVTIFSPEGDVAAEVAAEVAQISRDRFRRLLPLAAAMTALLVVVGAFAWFSWDREMLQVEVISVAAQTRGYGKDPDRFLVSGITQNHGELTEMLTGIHGETRDPDYELRMSLHYDEEATRLEQPAGRDAPWAAMATFTSTRSGMGLRAEGLTEIDWRPCLDFVDRVVCGAWRSWRVDQSFDAPPPVDLTASIGEGARLVISAQERFFVGTRDPNALLALSTAGDIETRVSLRGEPAAIAVDESRIFVATETPDEIVVLDATSQEIVSAKRIPRFTVDFDFASEDVSTRPISLLVAGDTQWLVTSGGSSYSGLLFSTSGNAGWTAYFDPLETTVDDLRLRAYDDTVWGVSTGTTPSSVFWFGIDDHVEFGGHEFDDVSCATDILPTGGLSVLLRDCEGELIELTREDERLIKSETLGRLRLDLESTSAGNIWVDELLARDGDVTLAAINVKNPAEGLPLLAGLVSLGPDGRRRTLFQDDDLHIVDLAAANGHALIIVEDTDGRSYPLIYRY